ncbi:HlyD family secretion protein [Paraburkholderia solisilvae]|uniref:p-hydroxybenzoic acid efflux pump subunit AaeA n=1 Tax=Paraburkholderia solisilvae TaxID=624376 RepID=A0A6J5DM94_9BURK|nr:HlyD family secretion protein [Paraburkholderia solisilvae]CAB3754637.1 p-hydroxybenzoic acid efflux pump subunit AaeA [Paraburkholderia solisilvae]
MSGKPDPSASAPAQAPALAADPSGKAVKWIVVLIVVSLIWYLLADRFTPYTQQARVQAYVVPVAAEVSGRVTRVFVHNNQEVDAGEVLFEIDNEQYRLAAERARADLESTRRQVGASTAGIDSALASLRAAIANETKARQDSERLERLYREDEGTVSLRRLEVARATHEQAQSQVAAARAEVERAREQQGGNEQENAQLRSAAAAVAKAELDLANTRIKARTGGVVTDLRTEVGQFAAIGSPVMTLIAIRDVWVSADMTENNLGHLQPGTPVAIALDALPGEVFEGRIRSIGYGVSVGQSAPPGGLPTVQNSRDWLRPAQRFPVIVEFGKDEHARLHNLRAGGQAEVMAFPSPGNPLNLPGRVFLHVMSWVSYLY